MGYILCKMIEGNYFNSMHIKHLLTRAEDWRAA